MKRNVILLGLTMIALTTANAASRYNLTLTQPMKVGSTELAAGEYKVEMQGDKAVFTSGKKTVTEIPAAVESAVKKYEFNAINATGTALTAIQVGGTNMKIVMKPTTGMLVAGQ